MRDAQRIMLLCASILALTAYGAEVSSGEKAKAVSKSSVFEPTHKKDAKKEVDRDDDEKKVKECSNREDKDDRVNRKSKNTNGGCGKPDKHSALVACEYTYSSWGDCDVSELQTRTLATSSPTDCTGTPTLSQSCVYVPPVPEPDLGPTYHINIDENGRILSAGMGAGWLGYEYNLLLPEDFFNTYALGKYIGVVTDGVLSIVEVAGWVAPTPPAFPFDPMPATPDPAVAPVVETPPAASDPLVDSPDALMVSHFVSSLGGGFDYIQGMTSDGINLYIADTGNAAIRMVVIATGEVKTFAGVIDQQGSDDGIGEAARFSQPAGIVSDGTYLYVTDKANYTLRKIDLSTREVTTLAGVSGDPMCNNARFGNPIGITTDGVYLYVADTDCNYIKRVDPSTGEITVVAGGSLSGSKDGIGETATFYKPYGITYNDGSLYVTDWLNSTVRKIVIETAEVTTIAGSSSAVGSVDGIGSAARFSRPMGITNDGTSLFVADSKNYTIRKIDIACGMVSTYAGIAGVSESTDGDISQATFSTPYALALDGDTLFVSEGNNSISKIE